MMPLIGIPSNFDADFIQLRKAYCDSLYRVGGLPVIIPITHDKNIVKQFVSKVDGILMAGGPDVDPSMYGEDPIPQIGPFNDTLDIFQKLVLDEAVLQKLPIFGICRGIQIMNVYFGGTLIQDIKTQIKDINNSNDTKYGIKHAQTGLRYPHSHSINIEKDTLLYRLFGNKESVRVNSLHHQAIKDLAKCFKVNARANDGVIEAVEKIDDPRIFAVQWHPEEATARGSDDFLPLFRYLVEKSSEFAKNRTVSK